MEAVRGPDSIQHPLAASPEAVLTHLVDTYQTPLRHICYMLLHDEALAEDAVQETFLKAYKGLHQFRGDSSEKTWLFHIGVNVCRDMRRGRWFRYVDRRVVLDTLPIPAPPQEDYADLAQAILQLPDKYREVVLLYYYQDMTIRDIAKTLGLAPSSVSNRLKKAHARLKDLLKRGDLHG